MTWICLQGDFPTWRTLYKWFVTLMVIFLTSCTAWSGSQDISEGQILPSSTYRATDQNLQTNPAPMTGEPATDATMRAIPDPGAIGTETFSPSDEYPLDRTQYSISVLFDYQQHHLKVDESVTFTNHIQDPLNEIVLVIEANREEGVFQLVELRDTNGAPIQNYILQHDRLEIPLEMPLVPGASLEIILSYELFLPPRQGVLGFSDRQTNLGNWYPYIAPYDNGQGWLIHAAASAGEHLVYDIADFRVDICVENETQGLIIAASSLAEKEGCCYRYAFENARNFTWSASQSYQVFTHQVGHTEVLSYVFPEHMQSGQVALQTASESLALYSKLFAPYPHASLSVVEGDFFEGMEFDGFFFLSKDYYDGFNGTPQEYLIPITAHETAHQWWYGLVGNDQAQEPWLDEALSTYSELLYYEAAYPELVDWWWDFRIHRFMPVGAVDSTIYDHDSFRDYVNAVYLQGALFIQDLRESLGDEKFNDFLKFYIASNAGEIVHAADFFMALENVSEIEFYDLVSNYFENTGR